MDHWINEVMFFFLGLAHLSWIFNSYRVIRMFFGLHVWPVFIISMQDGLTALHKAILCKKQAITNYLLRESANPFVRDKVSREI